MGSHPFIEKYKETVVKHKGLFVRSGLPYELIEELGADASSLPGILRSAILHPLDGYWMDVQWRKFLAEFSEADLAWMSLTLKTYFGDPDKAFASPVHDKLLRGNTSKHAHALVCGDEEMKLEAIKYLFYVPTPGESYDMIPDDTLWTTMEFCLKDIQERKTQMGDRYYLFAEHVDSSEQRTAV